MRRAAAAVRCWVVWPGPWDSDWRRVRMCCWRRYRTSMVATSSFRSRRYRIARMWSARIRRRSFGSTFMLCNCCRIRCIFFALLVRGRGPVFTMMMMIVTGTLFVLSYACRESPVSLVGDLLSMSTRYCNLLFCSVAVSRNMMKSLVVRRSRLPNVRRKCRQNNGIGYINLSTLPQ